MQATGGFVSARLTQPTPQLQCIIFAVVRGRRNTIRSAVQVMSFCAIFSVRFMSDGLSSVVPNTKPAGVVCNALAAVLNSYEE